MNANVMELKDGWTVEYRGQKMSSSVPGDITLDFFNNGLIDDPYFGLNHRELHFIAESDFEYENVFAVSDGVYNSEEILLEFDSIDTFSEIYLNGTLIGKTENMFLKYVYSVKEHIKKDDNVLKVKMRSTVKKMDAIDDAGYFGVFNTKRLFIRKAQCHFGWDWAPDMPGYGICGAVRVKGVYKNRIESVSYRAHNDGNVTIFAELNFSIRPQVDFNGKTVKEHNTEYKNAELRYTVSTVADAELSPQTSKVFTQKISGKKNFANVKIDFPQLWWPSGYGSQPLYNYKVELAHHGKVIDEYSGYLAFRTVELEQKPVSAQNIGYKFIINGREIFIKGSNWVPAECFIGCIEDKKYDILTDRAAEANLNMLRVWGGGIYEKDIFYELCDRKGIMVWQDLMFACADIPEDNAEFVSNVKAEVEYQIKRLRNHPSVVYWCGGNEKTGTYGLQICRGDYFVDVFLRGLVNHLDNTRPYARQSPCSLTDIGNDTTSGESHAGSFETALSEGITNYRSLVSKTDVPFVSECAIMGPCSLESLKKIFPEDKLWPINEYWNDRLMDNPYASILMPFAEREEHYANELYGESNSVEQFIAKGMTVHAETLRAEIEHARANKVKCGGFMNWMFSEIWQSATWAVVDYNLEPKQAYYQMKRSYAPILLTFTQTSDGTTALTLVNDTDAVIRTHVEYGVKTLSGEKLWMKKIPFRLDANGVAQAEVCGELDRGNTYLYAECIIDKNKYTAVYSSDMWHTAKFDPIYKYTVKKAENGIAVNIKAKSFVKGLTLRLPENAKYKYSDNYIDLQAGEDCTVYICGDSINADELTVTDFFKETADA